MLGSMLAFVAALVARAAALDGLTKTRARVASLNRESRVPATLVRAIAKRPEWEAPTPRQPRLAPEAIEVGITVTGCGGLYTYLFGVAAYVQQHFDLRGAAFASASAGAFPAFLLATGIDVERFHRTHNSSPRRPRARAGPQGGGRPSRGASALLGWNGLEAPARPREPGDDGHELLVGKHAVSITQVVRDGPAPEPRRFQNALVDDYVTTSPTYIASATRPLRRAAR